MYGRLLVSLLALTVIPVIVLQVFYSSYLISNIRNNRMQLVRDYGTLLMEDLLTSDYLEGNTSELIDTELRNFTGLYDGRALIINSSYLVRFDTYGMLTGKFMVTKASILAMQGSEEDYYDPLTDQASVTCVIKDDNEEIKGFILFFVSCSDLTNTYSSLRNTTIIVIFVFVAILTLLSFALARTFTRPFEQLGESINRISEGNFDENVNLSGFTEIETISAAFNKMKGSLKHLEETRQEFVSNVSHELKTPLTSMKVLADSLNTQDNVPLETYKDFMLDIGSEVDRENRIINDLLSLVKMDQGESQLNIANLTVNETLEAVLKPLRPIAARKGVELRFDNNRIVLADYDEVKLNIAISNLVENAIKYNIAGGWVHLSLDADETYFYITVEDSGIGIPEEYQSRIFERFYRVDKTRSRETGGTGLGLAITKEVIELHHGNIKVSSREDEGTAFAVRIPLVYKPEEENRSGGDRI
ncbi:MAG: HAMP domain-containing protein [Lachnospiraceae bacterium]|nr:HAMP domain-containing protein [Lachnospiraceae bacterium]